MQTKLDEAKAELLARAAKVADNSPGGGVGGPGGAPRVHVAAAGADGSTGAGQERSRQDVLLSYLQRYYLHTAPEDIEGRDPIDVFGAASSHYRLAEERPQGKANVRVHTPTVEENGWTCSHSVVEVVTDDMPFLVDSVTNELSRQGRGIHVVIHPQVVVRRDVTGKLVEVLTDGTGRDSGKGAGTPRRICRTTRSSSPGSTSRSTARPTAPTSSRSRTTCCASCPTYGRPSRTGRRCATRPCASPTTCPASRSTTSPTTRSTRPGAAPLARRRPLHLPRLPRVRAAGQ